MGKRKHPEPKSSSTGGENEDEKKILALILSKEGMGATTAEMKAETGIQQGNLITRALVNLKRSQLIKEVPNMNNKGIKHFLGTKFTPCSVLTGGVWYNDGKLDVSRIEDLKTICVTILEKGKKKPVPLNLLSSYFDRSGELSGDQTKEILKNLVLDNVAMEVKSTGIDEFAGIKIGELCYKLTGKKSGGGVARAGAFASVPCGACPHIALCTPGGVISPTTCSYFQKWLDF